MKKILTLLTLLVSVLSGFSQAGTTYRLKPSVTTISTVDNFLNAANWDVVSGPGTSPAAGAVLQIFSNVTISANQTLSGAFAITIGGGVASNTTFTLSSIFSLGSGSTINLQTRLAGCRLATLALTSPADILINGVSKAARSGGTGSLSTTCALATSYYKASSDAATGSGNHFGGFIPQAGGSTLPLQLKDFSAQKATGKVTLNWSTVLEINTSHFEVEQSNNGLTWKSIAVVPAKGNSNSVHKYSADDIAVYSSKVYYRLKMVDLDGKFEYSPISVVTFGGKGKMFAYPNPAASFTMISSDNAISENVTVSIFITTGILVKQQVIANPGNNFRVGLEDLKQGSYILKINKGAELLEVIKIQKN